MHCGGRQPAGFFPPSPLRPRGLVKPHDSAHGLRAVEYRGIVLLNLDFLIGQIRSNGEDGLAPFDAVVEATVQRSCPVILTALAAMLAFIPLTLSVFWGTLAYTLIGGTFGGTILTLVFLPALYAIWFRIGWRQAMSKPFLRFNRSLSLVSRFLHPDAEEA